MSDALLLDSLRQRVHEEVRQAVPRGPVALLDFPDYANPGDSAIWLGALECLRALGFDPPAYTSDQRTFDEASLRRALPRGTILFTGGGNLGDLWPRHQAFRERVLRGFPDHAIVQLPQSIHFDDPAALESARVAFTEHANVTLMVRDQRSMQVATEQLGCATRFSPDLAFCLPKLPERPAPSVDVLRLYRTDHESSRASQTSAHATVDWVDDLATPLRKFVWMAGDSRIKRRFSFFESTYRQILSACYPRLAEQRLRRGFDLLGSARLVATDRLHGHILAVLLGVSHIVIGDRNGKVRGFYDAWTSTSTAARWADSVDDAERMISDRAAG